VPEQRRYEPGDTARLQVFEYRTDVLCAVLPRKHPVKGRSLSFSKLLDYDFVGLEAKTFNGPVNYSSSAPALPAFQNTVIDSDIRLVMTRLNFKFGP